jgi:aspartyl-tRNA(Asn)/glutamyl-tRNA(Gln) amidotransferase subunit A
MAGENVLSRPAREVASQLRSGEVSSTGLLEQLLERIAATEPEVKAYLALCEDDARREAEDADREIQAGRARGILHGLPVSIKDLIDTNGVRTTYGSPIYKDHVPERDATVVRKLREAGAVVVGKTNTHEFALGGTTPPTRNPFGLDRIPGGSSGGSAAAVAAGSAFLALGSDTGGSIRIPASYCGVVGLKPTYGLVSRVGVFPESWSLDHIGPIGRHVEDAAVLLDAIAGFDPEDSTSTEIELPDYLAGIDDGVEGLTIGVPTNHFFEDLSAEVGAAARAAIEHLETCGAKVRDITFPAVDEILAAHAAIDLAEIAANHRRRYAKRYDDYLPETKPFVELGLFVRVTTYIDALRVRPRLLNEVLESMKGVDAIVVPSQPSVAPQVGSQVAPIDDHEEDLLTAMVRLLAQFNLTGQPALSVCCGYDASGHPIGLQIVGRPFDDRMVLRVAQAYQTSTPWIDRLLDGSVPESGRP